MSPECYAAATGIVALIAVGFVLALIVAVAVVALIGRGEAAYSEAVSEAVTPANDTDQETSI